MLKKPIVQGELLIAEKAACQGAQLLKKLLVQGALLRKKLLVQEALFVKKLLVQVALLLKKLFVQGSTIGEEAAFPVNIVLENLLVQGTLLLK